MKYVGSAFSDVGNIKETNQDSISIIVAQEYTGEQAAMMVMCDGMGGYEKGELASATVVKAFRKWFNDELPKMLEQQHPLVFAIP